MNTRSNMSLNRTWQAQIRQLATRIPKLAQALWQNRQVYYARFAHFYRQLANLPRKLRHKFLKRLAATLTGAALLLALGQAIPVRAAVITVDGVVCTLAEAITSANKDNARGNGCVDGSGVDIIDLRTDVTLSTPLPKIQSHITLEANGFTINGDATFQILNVQATGNLTLNDATITGGYAYLGPYNGGGIANNGGILTVNDSTFSNNTAGRHGGGLFNSGGTVVLNNNIFTGNWAGYGGGIFNENGTVEVNNTAFINNVASTTGGGGIANYGLLTVNDSTLDGNSASGRGGGIASDGTLMVNNTTFNENSANTGGGIFIIGGLMEMNNSTLTGNSTINFDVGGGIVNSGGRITINTSIISGNSAGLSGGGILNDRGTLSLINSTLNGNSAYIAGGIGNGGIAMVSNSTVSDNSSFYGGGITNNGTLKVINSTISSNSGYEFGGGILNNGMLMVMNSTLTKNFTGNFDEGGGIWNSGTVNLIRSLISGNSSPSGAEVFNEGIINANNFNVIGYDGSPRSVGFAPGMKDIVPFGALNTVLDVVLADNGGSTLTHALVAGSEAIDLIRNGDCSDVPIDGLDQRGFPRNLNGNGSLSNNECDAGAFEFDPGDPVTPTPIPQANGMLASPGELANSSGQWIVGVLLTLVFFFRRNLS